MYFDELFGLDGVFEVDVVCVGGDVVVIVLIDCVGVGCVVDLFEYVVGCDGVVGGVYFVGSG